MNIQLHYKEPCNERNTNMSTNSSKKCTICDSDGKYKCPTCLVYYCSVACCKKHREKDCGVAMEKPLPEIQSVISDLEYLTENTVPEERLRLLKNDKMLNDLLCNPHLRTLLKTVDQAENPEEMMQKAMQEPLFVEFADACLKVVEPETDPTEITTT